MRLDYLYVTGWSLLDDLKLIMRTVPAVLRRRDDVVMSQVMKSIYQLVSRCLGALPRRQLARYRGAC